MNNSWKFVFFFKGKVQKCAEWQNLFSFTHEKIRISDDSLTMGLFDYCGSLSQ